MSQLDRPPKSLPHLPVLRQLEGQLLSLKEPDTGDGGVALLPPQDRGGEGVPGGPSLQDLATVSLGVDYSWSQSLDWHQYVNYYGSVENDILGQLVQALEHAGHQVTGHEHLEDRMADSGGVEDREMRDLGEFTVESIVGPPQGVAGGVEVLPEIVAAGGLLVVAVEPLPGLQVECALGKY